MKSGIKHTQVFLFVVASLAFPTFGDTLNLPSLGVGYNTAWNENLFIEAGPVLQSDYRDFHLLCSFMGASFSNYIRYPDTINDSLQEIGFRQTEYRFDLQLTYTYKAFKFLSIIPGLSFAYVHFEDETTYRNINSNQTFSHLDFPNAEAKYRLCPNGTDMRFELSAKIAFWNTFYYRVNYGFSTKAPINQGIGYFIQSDRAFGFIEFAMITPHVFNNYEGMGYLKSGFGYYIMKNNCPNYWRLKNNPGLVGRILPVVLPGAILSIATSFGFLVALILGSSGS